MNIVIQREGGVTRIAFNRPDKKNAITSAMYAALADALADAGRDTAVRVVLLHGSSTVFTAGNDLEDFMTSDPASDASPGVRFMHEIGRFAKPLVAAVCGPAVGIGTTLLLHCDLVYAGEGARFNLPFVRLGLCPEAGASHLLPAIAGYQRAAEKFMLGEPFSAAEARDMGFVTRVLPDAEVIAHALAQAQALAALPASSLAATKALLKRGLRAPIDEQLTEELRYFRRLLKEPAAKEAASAFFERRKPDFAGVGA